MAITALILNKVENGFEVSFKATDGKSYIAQLVESKYGLYMLEHEGVSSMYKLTGLASVFDGGIKPSDALDLQVKICANQFDGEPKALAFAQDGGAFVAATGNIRYGVKALINCVPDGKGGYEAEWIGEGDPVLSDALEASILTRVRSSLAKTWRAANGVNV